jgi:hypothetical protein
VKPSRHACASVRRQGELHRGEQFVAAKAGVQEDVDEVQPRGPSGGAPPSPSGDSIWAGPRSPAATRGSSGRPAAAPPERGGHRPAPSVAPAGGRDDPLRGRAGEGSQFGAADRDERAQQRGAERVAEDLAALQVDERLVEGLGQPPDAEGLQFGLGTRRRDRRLARYQPLHAVRAELLRRAGTPRTRRTSARALALSGNKREREALRRRRHR